MNLTLTRRLLASTMITPFALLASPAVSQTAPAQNGAADSSPSQQLQATPTGEVGTPVDQTATDDIVVTGIRQSLAAARDIKRDATQFVDAIVADDIGKLPDTNVAESLARVSGVQVDRGIAEGTSVSVRGLRQNVFLFNGREIFDATGRGGTGLDQLGTSTYGILALVPSDLIARLEVTKLAGADQVAGALGGIVDIETRMPLDGPNQLAGKAGAEYDDLPGKAGYELFGLASHKFANNTLGVLLSGSYEKRNLAQQGLDTFSGYSRFVDATGTARFGDADIRPEEIRDRREKIGVDGVVQWRPSSDVELTLDSFYSKINSDRNRDWLAFSSTTGLTNPTYSSNNILVAGTSTAPLLTNTEFATTHADTWSSALRGKFNVADRVKTSAEISFDRSTSSYHQIYFRLQPLTTVTSTEQFDLRQGSFGSYTFSGINLTDPSQLRFTILFDNLYRAHTNAFAARNDWTVDFSPSFLKDVAYGIRYQHLDSVANPLLADIRPTGGIPATQLSRYLSTYSNNDFASGEFAGVPRTYLIAGDAVRGGCTAFTDVPSVSQNAQCLNPGATTNALAGTYDIKERYVEGYAKLDFATEIGSVGASGNVGFRYVNRHLDSIGNRIAASGAATPTVFTRSDDEWLPSATAKIDLSRQLIVRLGAAKVVAFPNSADLNNGLTLFNNAVFVNGVQTTLGTGNGGAPNLDPFKATQVDASLEHYFGKQALVSAGLFYKDVSTFIVQRQSAESYGGVNYLINRKINGDGATVKGVEALLQLPFYFLPGALDGFGLLATYSYIDSSTPIRDVVGRTLPFPGLSKNNVNLVGYYEKGPVSFRLAYNWRDDYLVALSAAATGIYNDSYADLSATARYDFSKRFSLTLEANNLLDEKQRTYDGSKEALRTSVFFGRIYKASVSVKF